MAQGKQQLPVEPSPTIELDISQFETLGIERFSERNDGLKPVDVVPMEDNIQAERQSCLVNRCGSRHF